MARKRYRMRYEQMVCDAGVNYNEYIWKFEYGSNSNHSTCASVCVSTQMKIYILWFVFGNGRESDLGVLFKSRFKAFSTRTHAKNMETQKFCMMHFYDLLFYEKLHFGNKKDCMKFSVLFQFESHHHHHPTGRMDGR